MAPRLLCTIPVCLLFIPGELRAQDAVDHAARLIGRPYVWGADGPDSFDCSGLTQYVYRQVGVDLPRRAVNQADAGNPAGRRLQRGDLLFFASDTRRSRVTHVGIYEGNGIMIDASQRHARVRRDSLDESYWIDRFMGARGSRPRRARDRSEGRRRDPHHAAGTGPEPPCAYLGRLPKSCCVDAEASLRARQVTLQRASGLRGRDRDFAPPDSAGDGLRRPSGLPARQG